MYTVNSGTVSETDKSKSVPMKEWQFQITNGNTKEVVINDPLLDYEAIAEERAMSEFLKGSYRLKQVSFSTHVNGLVLNDVINVRGLPYLVKSIRTSIDKVHVINTIRAARYE